jgi:hypothetical protein
MIFRDVADYTLRFDRRRPGAAAKMDQLSGTPVTKRQCFISRGSSKIRQYLSNIQEGFQYRRKEPPGSTVGSRVLARLKMQASKPTWKTMNIIQLLFFLRPKRLNYI